MALVYEVVSLSVLGLLSGWGILIRHLLRRRAALLFNNPGCVTNSDLNVQLARIIRKQDSDTQKRRDNMLRFHARLDRAEKDRTRMQRDLTIVKTILQARR